ncbi:TNF receptor-associated factor 6-like [Stylophora pistillata]|uniref:TNF receptor-associated factor 6-like n=1 Tax=Stylophora pistillata TaxID=50429 RepID=UPI000C056E39|nr:TNF receptor-associated factor 6-like [Stylophora pistillata]
MPGFRVSHSDLDGLDDKFQCRLCGFVFRDPVQTSCGHVYCHSCCFESTTDVLCVEDGTVIREKESFRDRYMEREVLRQEVGCTFQDEGCSWRGMICHLEAEEVSTKGVECPRTLIYVRNYQTCGELYNFFINTLQDKAY